MLVPVDDLPPAVPADAALLQVLLGAGPLGVACYDLQGRYVLVNDGLAAAHGLPAAAHVGLTTRQVVPQLADRVEELLARVVAGGEPVLDVELSLDGPPPVHWTTAWYPLHDPATGALSGVAVLASDITTVVETGASLRATALTLQRSLLPTQVPSTEELDVAVRYAAGAAETEVGGDWYDVLALGGGRLAVVIGDVMGRGVPAAAVMGQLRTAVRTCARLDLQPAEVLDVLDGLVADLDDDQIATCVYGVFDPHTRELQYASAGHVPPLVRSPAGAVTRVAGEVSAPLGVRDAPRQTSVRLRPGEVLALFTDGLVERRGQDLDEGLDALAGVLATGPREVEPLADAVLAALGRDRHDDMALLLLRVPDDVDARSLTVVVEVPRERALLFDVRVRAREVMRSWALLEEVVDTATLLASELVTNGLVHGRGTVELRLRLTRDRLVLEAVDAGRHMPRRRRAGEDEEGGRGLHLVAHLADRWGFRATESGKVVWAEIDLAGP